jgi:Putative Ig domain
VPKVVLSTDYTFSASAKQDERLAKGEDSSLEVSGYYSGRAYGPAVVQNPDGSLTMVFSGYRLPKPVTAVGTVLGTSSDHYVIGAKDPAIYRNILTLHLTSSTSPGVPTTTSISPSDGGTGAVGAPVIYTATCVSQHESPAGANEVTATYAGDANYAGSSGSVSENVTEAPAITSEGSTTFTDGSQGSFTVTASGTPTPAITSPDSATFNDHVASSFTVNATGTPAPVIAKWGNLPEGVSYSDGVLSGTPTQIGTFQVTFTASNGIGAASTQQFTLTVLGLHVTTTSLPQITPGTTYSDQLQATGGVPPYVWKVGGHSLPKGFTLSAAGVLAGKTSTKIYPSGTTFPITVTVTDHTKKVHQTPTASFTLVIG